MRRSWHERLEAKTLKYKKRVIEKKEDPQYINKTEEEAFRLEEKYMQVPKEKYRQLLFSKRIVREDCWIWEGKQSHGYGSIWIPEAKVNARVHVLALFLFERKRFSFKKQVNHTCDTKRCFNPEHLYAGTQTENMNDYLNPKPKEIGSIYPSLELRF